MKHLSALPKDKTRTWKMRICIGESRVQILSLYTMAARVALDTLHSPIHSFNIYLSSMCQTRF